MTKKIYRHMLLLALLAVVLTAALSIAALYDFFSDRIVTELRVRTAAVSVAMNDTDDKAAYLEKLYRTERDATRVTWIAADGTVLYDSVTDASKLENHADREEFKEALATGRGESRRQSVTLSENTVNYAARLDDGSVIRLSGTQKSAWGLVWGMATPFVLIVGIVAVIAAISARTMTAKIVAPINRIDPEEPESIDTYDELAPMVTHLRVQNIRIDEQLKELKRKQDEFAAVTGNMAEGLVLTDGTGHIIFINRRAAELFGVDAESNERRHILAVNRSAAVKAAYDGASEGRHTEELYEHDDKAYRVIANPVKMGEKHVGAALLLLDVTDKTRAEEQRREFSANVSHELKTPLQSISGYAEIMKDGIAKQKDMQDFSQRIYDESQRLIALVDDIIHLSRLDEGDVATEHIAPVEVELNALCHDVARILTEKAHKLNVRLTVEGEEQTVTGVKPILTEMVMNLVDNAVKYNVDGGSVTVATASENGRATVTVTDTGIGIPKELCEKVFERFYRVDKSHSKETGGTGLGLSIVKHGAAFHNAKVQLTSEIGKGTVVKLIF